MMGKIINNKISVLAVLFLIGLTPLLWFKPGMQIAGADEIGYLSFDHYTESWRYAWNEKINAGFVSHDASQIIPLYFWKILRHSGCSPSLIGRLWLIFLWMPAGFFMCFLFKVIFPRGSNFVVIAAVLLYLYNTFTMLGVYQPSFHTVYAVFPAIHQSSPLVSEVSQFVAPPPELGPKRPFHFFQLFISPSRVLK